MKRCHDWSDELLVPVNILAAALCTACGQAIENRIKLKCRGLQLSIFDII